MKVLSKVCFIVLCLSSVALADLYTTDFGTGSAWLRNGDFGGWYSPSGQSTNSSIKADDAGNTLPGMSGQVASSGYSWGGDAVYLLPGLSDLGIVSAEVSMASRGGYCTTYCVFGFVTDATVVNNGGWNEVTKSMWTSGLYAGLNWGSRYSGVQTLECFAGSTTADASFDVGPDEVVRQKLSLDLHTDTMKLEMKRYVNGVWEPSYTTVIDWTSVGADLSALNIDGVQIYAGKTMPSYYQMDDLTVIPEPATMTILGLGGLALIRKRK